MTLFAAASKLDWGGWVRGVAGAFISGGAAAVGGGFGSIVADPEHFNVVNGGFKHVMVVMGIAFLFSAIISLMKFLQLHPVPDVVTTTTTTGKTTTTTTTIPPQP